jgi:3-oxoacid CoA-transferase subunit B
MIPSRGIGNVGGAMDLAVGAKRVIVSMEHVDRAGNPKVVINCSFPLTCPTCVDMIVTDIAVISVEEQGLVLRETAPGWTADEIQNQTGAKLITSPLLKEITL